MAETHKIVLVLSREVIMTQKSSYCIAAGVAVGVSIVMGGAVYAAPVGVSNIENFIRNIIQVVAGLAGLIATGFFVIGGLTYITSSGNPEQLDRAKRTITWSAVGLVVVIAAYVLTNLVTSLAHQSFGG